MMTGRRNNAALLDIACGEHCGFDPCGNFAKAGGFVKTRY